MGFVEGPWVHLNTQVCASQWVRCGWCDHGFIGVIRVIRGQDGLVFGPRMARISRMGGGGVVVCPTFLPTPGGRDVSSGIGAVRGFPRES